MKQFLAELFATFKRVVSEYVDLLMVLAYAFAITFVLIQLMINIIAANYMSAFMVVFYIATVILLHRTFKATDRTARAAENAESAHVFLEVKTRFCGDDGEPPNEIKNKREIEVIIGIRNYGKTPAVNVDRRIARNKYFDGIEIETDHAGVDVIGPDEFFEIRRINESTGVFFNLGRWVEATAQPLNIKGYIEFSSMVSGARTRVHISDGNLRFQKRYGTNYKPMVHINDLRRTSIDDARDFRLMNIARPYFRATQKVTSK